MLTGIDHLVVAVDDPDAAAERVERTLGLHASGGGRHDALGTLNRLVWLGDSYLELIGVFDRAAAAGSWLGAPTLAALERGGGLVSWAVGSDGLDADLARLRAQGVALAGPIDGARRRRDGREVRWRLARPSGIGPASPFLIEHDASAAEWTPADRAMRSEERHPLGGRVRLAGLRLAVDDVVAVEASLRRLLGGLDLGRQRIALLDRRRGGSRGMAAEPEATIELAVEPGAHARDADLLGCAFRFTVANAAGEAPPGSV